MIIMRCFMKTIDRPAMILDVLKELATWKINILSMKVSSGRIIIKLALSPLLNIKEIISRLESWPEIISLVWHIDKTPTNMQHKYNAAQYSPDIIFKSAAIRDIIAKAQKVADNRYTVLIRGETGTGKELLARAIHYSGTRRHFPFVPVNCSALPESLMESEFFGYEKGAFSGADSKGKKGLFEQADRGTLFLDEFGELPLGLQAKLLRVLQDGGIRRVGGNAIVPLDVRIIVATNANLEEMLSLRQLRRDLYYRINVFTLTIPPLRERPEDISLLIGHFIEKYNLEFRRQIALDQAAFDFMCRYPWPGNVRELENTIMRLTLMSEQNIIGLDDLLRELPHPGAGNDLKTSPAQNLSFKEQVHLAERELIEKMLHENISSRHIAKVLGVSHTTVLNKIKNYHF